MYTKMERVTFFAAVVIYLIFTTYFCFRKPVITVVWFHKRVKTRSRFDALAFRILFACFADEAFLSHWISRSISSLGWRLSSLSQRTLSRGKILRVVVKQMYLGDQVFLIVYKYNISANSEQDFSVHIRMSCVLVVRMFMFAWTPFKSTLGFGYGSSVLTFDVFKVRQFNWKSVCRSSCSVTYLPSIGGFVDWNHVSLPAVSWHKIPCARVQHLDRVSCRQLMTMQQSFPPDLTYNIRLQGYS